MKRSERRMMIRLLAFKDYSGSCIMSLVEWRKAINICSLFLFDKVGGICDRVFLFLLSYIYSNSVT